MSPYFLLAVIQTEKNARKAKRLASEMVLPMHVPVNLMWTDALHEIVRGLLWVRSWDSDGCDYGRR